MTVMGSMKLCYGWLGIWWNFYSEKMAAFNPGKLDRLYCSFGFFPNNAF